MFRSPSRFKVSLQLLLAAVLFTTLLVVSSVQAQSSRRSRETNANRRARIAKQIQETYTHRWEVGGGGGFLRFRSGAALQKNSEISFWMNTTYFLNQKLGITGELRGSYGNAKVGNTIYNIPDPQISEYPFLVGPTYRVRLKEHYSVGVFALAGTAIGKFDGASKGIPATLLGMWPSTNARPAFSLGANADINLYPNLAFRIAPSYLGTTFGGSLQNNYGFDMGLVYRFGRQK